MLNARNCPAGRMMAAIDNGFGGVIFHEACGHSLEATSVAKGNSVFSDCLGKQIASSKVTAIDDGTLPNHWGSINVDDEGTPGRKNVLIENGKGNSVFSDCLGKQIASSKVTAIDDGTLPNHWGSINVDDEGTPGRKNVLIENGILKSYMIDKLNGRRMGMDPTGNARRQSYKFAPTSRMTNTYIAAGEDDPKDIIASIPEGLYAKNHI